MKYLFPGGIGMYVLSIRRHFKDDRTWLLVITALTAGICQSATAATLCVNPGGTSGCYSTIGAAVMQARMDYLNNGTIDIINVAPGTYKEDVIILTPLSLVGAGPGRSVINAVGLPNGIYIDGVDAPNNHLSQVVVTGFTVENANFEGILVTNASFVIVRDNEVIKNDLSLNVSVPACPDQPAFETSETNDCGEGIHLIGVDHSTVGNNTSKKNSGGILLTDETGATHHNLIIGNLVQDNPFDCGITLASHPSAPNTGLTSPPGVYSNTIANNESLHNGYQVPGAGAGVGIFAPGPGNQAYANVVINNQLQDNGLPGVALHNHAALAGAPAVNLNDNVIVGNSISGNGADTADAATPGPTGINVFGITSITGTLIAGNVINRESVDIATNTPRPGKYTSQQLTRRGYRRG